MHDLYHTCTVDIQGGKVCDNTQSKADTMEVRDPVQDYVKITTVHLVYITECC